MVTGWAQGATGRAVAGTALQARRAAVLVAMVGAMGAGVLVAMPQVVGMKAVVETWVGREAGLERGAGWVEVLVLVVDWATGPMLELHS